MGPDVKFLKLANRERLEILKRITWLSERLQRSTFAGEALFLRYPAHQPIFRAESSADRVFFLLAGMAKLYYSHRKRNILVTSFGGRRHLRHEQSAPQSQTFLHVRGDDLTVWSPQIGPR